MSWLPISLEFFDPGKRAMGIAIFLKKAIL